MTTANFSLKARLSDWTDADGAAYYLACCLGLMDTDSIAITKHVFWSNNQVGNMLYKILDNLAENGILEKRDEPDYQYRWSAKFKGTWQ